MEPFDVLIPLDSGTVSTIDTIRRQNTKDGSEPVSRSYVISWALAELSERLEDERFAEIIAEGLEDL